jgi:hypothetical protein
VTSPTVYRRGLNRFLLLADEIQTQGTRREGQSVRHAEACSGQAREGGGSQWTTDSGWKRERTVGVSLLKRFARDARVRVLQDREHDGQCENPEIRDHLHRAQHLRARGAWAEAVALGSAAGT